MYFRVALCTAEDAHQSQDVGGRHPTLSHLVHARLVTVSFSLKDNLLSIKNKLQDNSSYSIFDSALSFLTITGCPEIES